jgi:uncharacterized protein YndB with AHSA1/START domain
MTATLAAERSLVIEADREKVWRAITEPKRFSKWFEMDIHWNRLAVGEVMTFTHDEGTDKGKIVTVDPPQRFAFNWTADPADPAETLVTFVLEVVPGGTRVTITEAGFEKLPQTLRQKRYEMNSKGWEIQLGNIANYMRTTDDEGV